MRRARLPNHVVLLPERRTMKLRDKNGELYDIVNILSLDKEGGLWLFSDGYDLVDDIGVCVSSVPEKTVRLSAGHAKKEQSDIDQLKQEIRKNSIDINQQLHAIQTLFSRVHELESKSNHRNP